jgi:hypothetical protein
MLTYLLQRPRLAPSTMDGPKALVIGPVTEIRTTLWPKRWMQISYNPGPKERSRWPAGGAGMGLGGGSGARRVLRAKTEGAGGGGG